MKKQTKTKLGLDKMTITKLDRLSQQQIVGGTSGSVQVSNGGNGGVVKTTN